MTAKFTFMSKDGQATDIMKGPHETCKASQIVWDVLNAGPVPDGLKLQYAPSYGAHFVSKKGKNALGFFNTNNMLVVNGIADELKEAGFGDKLIVPQKGKSYFAIRVADLTAEEIKKVTKTAARILGFVGGPSPVSKKKRIKKEKAPKTAPKVSEVVVPA